MVLKFTDTTIDLFLSNNNSDCEIPQCDNSHPESDECEKPHDEVRDSALITAENRIGECEKPQSNIPENTDIENVTDTYNIINNKNSIDKNISNNNSDTSIEDFSIIKFDDDATDDKSGLSESEEKHIPIIGKDFNPKEELIIDTSKGDGKSYWKLKNDVTSNFIDKDYAYKLVDVYNQWINLNIKENSLFSFKVIEIIVINIILSTPLGNRIDNNQQLNMHFRIYSINDVVNDISDYIYEQKDDFGSVVTKVMPYKLNVKS